MPDLKKVLMEMGNKLVTEHRFGPANARGPLLSLEDKTTHLIAEFTKFVNEHPEAQQVLKELGYDWSVAYKAQTARDAQRTNYGDKPYWDYLERHAAELAKKGVANAFTRTLADALKGNEGE